MNLFQQQKKLTQQCKNQTFISTNQFTETELPIASLIQQRRLQMLVHSRLYYELNTNLISDTQFDNFANELAQLQQEYPEIACRVCYSQAFEDWDGSTGAFLPLNDDWVIHKTNHLLNLQRKEIKTNETSVTQPKKKQKQKTCAKGLFSMGR